MNRSTWQRVGIGVLDAAIPILAAFLIGALAILLAGEDPLNTYWTLFNRTFMNMRGLMRTLHFAAPLILTGLAIAISFKAGFFNMGVEGQVLAGGFVVAIFAIRFAHLPSVVLIPLCLVLGVMSGMLAALIPGLLKAFFNVNELVVTLLLNYAIFKFFEFLTTTVFRDPTASHVSTHMIGANAIIRRLGDTRLTPFFFVAMAVFVIMWFVFNRSKFGFEVTAIGKNMPFAEATGMQVRKKVIYIMLVSGALAGLAGAGWMMSAQYVYTLDFSGNPGLGWDGMLIALLGAFSPIGIFIAAVFYAGLKVGSHSIAIFTSVPAEIIGVLQALIILFLSVKFLHQYGERILASFKQRKVQVAVKEEK